MKPYWLCKDVRGFNECDRCMRIPRASEHACADVKPAAEPAQ